MNTIKAFFLSLVTATLGKLFEGTAPPYEKHSWIWYFKEHFSQAVNKYK